MSKPSRKLSLKKETVRQLDAGELAQVGGGYLNVDWVIMRQPTKPTNPTGTEPGGLFANYNLNYYNLYYW